MKHTFLVQHTHQVPRGGGADVKIIGLYDSASSARLAVQRTKKREGFRDSPGGFAIDRYELGKDHWREGFVPAIYREKKAVHPPRTTAGLRPPVSELNRSPEK